MNAYAEPSDCTALLGAGISMDAGLPGALAFGDALIDALVGPMWARSELKRLMRTNRDDSRDEHDNIRFETLIDWIGEVFDAQLGFFNLLDEFEEPAAIHLMFATSAISGCVLLTPNFDDLLERAVTKLGAQPVTVDAHAPSNVTAGVPVIKLHGTRRVHRAGGIELSTSPLLTTVESIAAASPGTLINHTASDVLRTSIDDRILIVSGYSASDDLDIVPALELCRPRRVVWIDHAPGRSRRLRPREPRRGDPTWRRLTAQWSRQGTEIDIRRGLTVRIVSQLGWKGTLAPKTAPAPADWRHIVQIWADRVRGEDPTGLGLAGLLFANLGRYDWAERAFRHSRGVRRAGAGWSTARRKYEIAQTALLKTGSQPARASRLATAAAREARVLGEPEYDLFSGIIQSRARFLMQDFDAALAGFQQLETLAEDPHHKAYTQSWQGKTLVSQGQYAGALAPLEQALSTLRQLGDLEICLDTLEAQANASLGLGDFVAAETDLREAEHIAALLGFVDRRCTVTINLGWVAFGLGDLTKARRLAREAISFAESGNDEVSVAWLLLARIEICEGRLAAARAAIGKARATATEITAGTTAELDTLAAHIELLAGRKRLARDLLAAAWGQPATRSTQWAHVHGLAISWLLGIAATSDLRAELSTWRPQSIEQQIVDGALLHSLDINLPEMTAISQRALEHARSVGAQRWIDILET